MTKRLEPLLGELEPHLTPTENENRQLRAHLQDLLEQAHNNQNILQRHHTLNLALIGANGLVELLNTIFLNLKETASLDSVTLTLCDEDYEIRRVMSNLNINPTDFPNLLFQSTQTTDKFNFPAPRQPALGLFSEDRHADLFLNEVRLPASVAIVPLYRHQRPIGHLNFGSHNPARFTGNIATDFIEEQASIIAICLENVINSERLTHIGLTDPLTGVNNRRHIETRLQEEIKRAQRQGYPLSCLFIDIDYFKQINDVLGHQEGDEVLREVATRIKSELRLSDALGRFGGEEFVVVLIDTDAVGANQVAERIRLGIANRKFRLSGEKSCQATVSIGISSLSKTPSGKAAEDLAQDFVGQADIALYQAKNSGRNRVCRFT